MEQQMTSNLYYLQVDHRFEGDYSWEELVVCSSTPEEAIKLAKLDPFLDYTLQKRVYVELIGVAINREHGILCVGDHNSKLSFDVLKEEIRYVEDG